MERFEVTIIGAGVVGLAIAAGYSQGGKGLVVERHESFGREASSRNSEVIHTGIYYPPGSFKARFCVEGRRLVYGLCEEYNINYKRIGKIIVATNTDEDRGLERLYKQGLANGVGDLRMVTGREIKKMEPHVNATSGIYSPSTGIVDTHSLMKYLELKAKENGTTFAYGCEVVGIEKVQEGYKVTVKDVDGELYSFSTRILINSAGLESDRIAGMAGIEEYKLYYCKGEYFKVGGGKNRYLSRLIYPHPTEVSLGIHTVMDLQGQLKLGPSAFYVDEINYDLDSTHTEEIWSSVSRYLPFIELDDITPDMAGIRAKLQAPGEGVKDFVICHETERGLSGFINLIGIDSPGFTAAPAIGRYVLDKVNFLS